MTLDQLITEALEKSPEFKAKYDYWLFKRGKSPDADWFYKNLVAALGERKVKQAINSKLKEEG